MEHRALGASGLTVPVVGMGTWSTFDVRGTAAEANARRVVDRALEADAIFFDSSPMYGESERVLGQALDGRRAQAQIATKVWTPNAAEGRRQVERALVFYGGHVELYQIHNLVNWREHLKMLEQLKEDGRASQMDFERSSLPCRHPGDLETGSDDRECRSGQSALVRLRDAGVCGSPGPPTLVV
jgi:aryl-alcohol dehydrogenase-like predicted oxidoreductase